MSKTGATVAPDPYEKRVKGQFEWSNSKIPTGDDGFVTTFKVTDNFMPFLQEWGFVCLQILTESEITDSINSFFEDVTNRNSNPNAVPINFDPDSYSDENWPSCRRFVTDDPAMTYQAVKNRTNPFIELAFKKIFNTEKLLVNMDGWGVMRPSIGHPEYRNNLNPHLDVNPWDYKDELLKKKDHIYQGVLHLNGDITAGGFCIVPKCCGNNFYQWVDSLGGKKHDRHSYYPYETDPIFKKLQKVSMKPGTMVIWDSSCCHANYPNTSYDSMRIVQYIRMMPATSIDTPGHRLKKLPGYLYDKYINDPALIDAVSRLNEREQNLLGVENCKKIKRL